MFHIVLHTPQVPPNTGNIIRLCANTGAALHLVRPLGFRLDARSLRRAGLDYDVLAHIAVHDDFSACRKALPGARWFAVETGSAQAHSSVTYQAGDALLFGSEQNGLPAAVLADIPPSQRVSIPMRAGNRSLNLANAVAIVVYEAWRQSGYT